MTHKPKPESGELDELRDKLASECIEKWLNERKGPFYNHATLELRQGFMAGFDAAARQVEELRAEIERLKMNATTLIRIPSVSGRNDRVLCGITLEKEKDRLTAAVKVLRAGVGYYANEKNWYRTTNAPGSPELRMVIGGIDTDGDTWIGGHTAREALQAADKVMEEK